LSENYSRGYLEDVDFCLRARLHGFRNVCAPSVYVGHAGSRSFGKQKRTLVVRNLRLVEHRFPDYRQECADFVLADPLKAARRAIELAMMVSRPRSVLLVTPAGATAEVAHQRGRQLLSEERLASLILEVQYQPGRLALLLRDAHGGVPQSLEFTQQTDDLAQLLEALGRVQLHRIELFDHEAIPRSIIDALQPLGIPSKIVPVRPLGSVSNLQGLAGAECLLAADEQAEAAATGVQRYIKPLTRAVPRSLPALRRMKTRVTALALLPIRRCVREFHFMRELVVKLTRTQPDLDIVVTGYTSDDEALIRAGAFVTGPIELGELNGLFQRYRMDRIVACATEPLFGHPVFASVMAGSIPVAFRDWSRGTCRPRDGDLALHASASIEQIVAQLSPWLAGGSPA
jgi:hypothetical protein